MAKISIEYETNGLTLKSICFFKKTVFSKSKKANKASTVPAKPSNNMNDTAEENDSKYLAKKPVAKKLMPW